MNPQQTRALETAQAIENNELRTRIIMLVLANNVEGVAQTMREAWNIHDLSPDDWNLLITTRYHLVRKGDT